MDSKNQHTLLGLSGGPPMCACQRSIWTTGGVPDGHVCHDDGIVRGGPMHHGTDYPCTGHAHYAGEHIKCLSPAHPDGLPADLLDALGHEGLDSDESAVVRSATRHVRGLP